MTQSGKGLLLFFSTCRAFSHFFRHLSLILNNSTFDIVSPITFNDTLETLHNSVYFYYLHFLKNEGKIGKSSAFQFHFCLSFNVPIVLSRQHVQTHGTVWQGPPFIFSTCRAFSHFYQHLKVDII